MTPENRFEELENEATNELKQKYRENIENISEYDEVFNNIKKDSPGDLNHIIREYYRLAGCTYSKKIYDLSKQIELKENEPRSIHLDDYKTEIRNLKRIVKKLYIDTNYKKDEQALEKFIKEDIYILKNLEIIVENMLEGIKADPEEFAKSAVEKNSTELEKAENRAEGMIKDLKDIRQITDDKYNKLKENYIKMCNLSQDAIESIQNSASEMLG